MKTIYLVDGSAYIHRAFHAVRNLSNSKGLPTNAVFGFTNMMLKLVNDKKPEYAAMVFDAKGPTFRHEIFKDYKANRPPMDEALAVQIPYIKDITEAFNMPMLEMQGYEADDLIGTLAKKAEEQGFMVVMVTGDKDFNQLVTHKSVVWDPMKDETRTVESITEKTGLPPDKVIEIMALSGDSSDNIPGVPGIGPKTAIALIQEFGSLEGVYEGVETITKKKQKENLQTYKDDALLSHKLVTIATDAPVEFDPEKLRIQEPDSQKLAKLFSELEFRDLSKAYPVKTDLSKKEYTALTTEEDLKALAESLEKAGVFALDTETTGLDPMRASLVGMSFSFEADKAFYVPCTHDYLGAPDQVGVEKALEILEPVLSNPEIKKIGQNIKYDWIVLARHGADLQGVAFDTMVASYLLNPSHRSHGLDQIAMELLEHRMISYEEVCGKGAKAITFNQVPLEKAVPYACEDADVTFQIYGLLQPKLEKNELLELFETVEMPLVGVLVKMEMEGITVDSDQLQALSREFQGELESAEKEIYQLAGEEFNIASPQQLGHILFEKLGLPVQKKTKKKTGYSTDVNVLTTLASKHELPALILRYRSVAKLKSTYVDALQSLIHPQTGRVHTSFNQNVTATGRLSSSNPNLQNIPIRTPEGKRIREAFVPRKGWELFCADYSQIELRILAHLSQDEFLIELFKSGEDIHKRTASEVFELFPEFVTDEMRRQAKAINFGIIYGMGAFRLSNEIGVSRKTAQRYIDNYFVTYKGVKKFIEETIAQAHETGMTKTLLGRTRPLPDINAKNRVLKEAAERIATNTPIQGTAADLIKVAMIKVQNALEEQNMQTKMLLTVHDELVFESPPEEVFQAQVLAEQMMEGVWDLDVTLKVNIESGKNWAEAH
ncbi:DNA polymerase I [Desulfatibacillum alkenivorans DSM 16219]|jgi:DNA polymerase-1|uniref:DNA polymerase I n=1 Tax=Desulfatibacillum alkenivorans DSM 16219 TaxID=1121393 RepID=A0A1M6GYQ6_9BACT|nr:DNA polymerase I [Desulfatibacillum alkenivorans]SHJ15091.1 DNA polymerase I [Desulfatibacillum alkenivorans DSM 16219]